jgi:hypothetical protein
LWGTSTKQVRGYAAYPTNSTGFITVGLAAAEGFLVFEEGDGAHASWSQGIEEVCRDVSACYAVLRVALLALTMMLRTACADHRLRRQRRSAQPPCGLARSHRRIRVSSASLFRVILRTFHQSVRKARYHHVQTLLVLSLSTLKPFLSA